VQPQALDVPSQGAAGNAQEARGARHVATGPFERRLDAVARRLRGGHGSGRAISRRRVPLEERLVQDRLEVLRGNKAPRVADGQPFEGVPQLAHVAVPLASRQARQRIPVENRRREAQAALDQQEAGASERRDVAAARSQGRHVQVHHVEAEVEVRPKAAGAHVVAQIAARRGHDPRGHRERFHTADPLVLAVLQNAKQRGLQVRSEFAYFVEEQGPARGALEATRPPRHRPGECAALVAKELALDHRWRQRCAVGVHERAATASRHPVQDPSGEPLPDARLAREENRGLQRRDVGDRAAQ
jgi:hypothetical protein